jgi:hypothetical protein
VLGLRGFLYVLGSREVETFEERCGGLMRNMKLEVLKDTATVEELKKMLAHVPGHFLVYTEGCDCTGDCHSVDIDDLAECVEIRRGK